ncbi:uncharacterized protein [Amphiura filiformis]
MDTWEDDVRLWPNISDQGIQDYFLNRPACDDQANSNYRSLIEGQNYLRSGWIGRIVHKINNDQIVLKGPVRFSQSINNNHNVEVFVQRDNNQVIDAQCDCMAGKGRCCSHMAGFLYKINTAATLGYIGSACTDQVCAWNNSTSKNVLPDTVENIRASEDSTSKSQHIETTAFDTDEDLINHLQSPQMAGIASIPGTILHHILTAKPVIEQPSTFTNLPKEHNNCEKQQCELCNDVFEKHVKCTPEQRQKLMRATAEQSSSLWLQQRKLRITSSEA